MKDLSSCLFFCNQILHKCSCENQSYRKVWGQSDESSCWVKTTQKTSLTGWIIKQIMPHQRC